MVMNEYEVLVDCRNAPLPFCVPLSCMVYTGIECGLDGWNLIHTQAWNFL